MRRSRGRVVLTLVFALLALNAWVQVVLRVLLGASADPAALTILQALIGLAGGAAAWGTWAGTRWAPVAAVLYGLVTAGMLMALTPLLDLPPDGRAGLWTGAAAVLLFAIWAARYLRRTRFDDPTVVGPERRSTSAG
jgi:hypothetical protein